MQEGKKEPAGADAHIGQQSEEPIDFSNVVIEPLFQDQVDFETFSKSDFRAVKVLVCEAVKKSKKLLKFTLDDGTGTPRTILSGIHAFYEPEELIGKTCIAVTNHFTVSIKRPAVCHSLPVSIFCLICYTFLLKKRENCDIIF